MKNNEKKNSNITLGEKLLPYTETTVRKLTLICSIMFLWLLIWALVFKLCDEEMIVTNYYNLRYMTLKERIEWDLIPFNYRGEAEYKVKQMIATVLNCFVLAPLGVLFPFVFKKMNVLRDAGICLLIVTTIESLQLITTLGNPATEDFITNMAGYFIGLAFYHLIFKRLHVKQNVVFFSIVSVLLAAATVYSLITTVNTAEIIYKIITRTL